MSKMRNTLCNYYTLERCCVVVDNEYAFPLTQNVTMTTGLGAKNQLVRGAKFLNIYSK